MADYKSDQDRFFQQLQELDAFQDAAEKEQLRDARHRIDKVVAVALKGHLAETEEQARAWVIEGMKQLGKLPADFTYPG